MSKPHIKSAAVARFSPVLEQQLEFSSSQDTNNPNVIVKRALVAVEGSFKDAANRPHDFSADRLNTIADFTNQAIQKGITIPVCVDHKKDFHSTVGCLGENAQVFTKVIQEGDLPQSKATHLLGKIGLFIDQVCIKAKSAVEQVRDGVVTSVSMGLNLDPKDHRIVELSLVPIPAIPAMGLFSKFDPDALGTAFTWEELETSDRTLDDLREDFDELNDKMWRLLDNVYTSESADIADIQTLKQYVFAILNGYNIRVLEILGLNDNEDEQEEMLNNAPTLSAANQDQLNQVRAQGVSAPSASGYASYSSPVRKGLLQFTKYAK